jgi:hypothetical protein
MADIGQILPARDVPQRHRPRRKDIARVCRAIHRYLEIEATRACAAKRNARLRMLIGLPPFPRRRVTKAHARAVQ